MFAKDLSIKDTWIFMAQVRLKQQVVMHSYTNHVETELIFLWTFISVMERECNYLAKNLDCKWHNFPLKILDNSLLILQYFKVIHF